MVVSHQKELRPGSAGEAGSVCHRDNLVIPAVDDEGLPCPWHRVRFGIAGEIDGRCHEEEPRRLHLPGGNRCHISAHAGTGEDNGARFPGASCQESADPRLRVGEIGVVYALDVKPPILCYGGQCRYFYAPRAALSAVGEDDKAAGHGVAPLKEFAGVTGGTMPVASVITSAPRNWGIASCVSIRNSKGLRRKCN